MTVYMNPVLCSGDNPQSWKVDRLKDCLDTVIGGEWGDDPDSDSDGEELVVLRVADFRNAGISDENLTIRKIKQSKVEQRLVSERSLLIEKSGGGEKQWVGRVVYPSKLPFRAISSNFIAKLDVSSKHDPRFFNYVFDALYKARVNKVHVRQTTGIQNLFVPHYLSIYVALPELISQKLIADFLDLSCEKIDQTIEIKRQQLEKLDRFRVSIIQRAVTQGLDSSAELKDSGIDWLGKVPKHWRVARIKRHATMIRGKFTHRPRNDPALYGGKYPFFQTGSIAKAEKYITEYHQTLNEQGMSVSRIFSKGTIVMSIAANIGDVAITDFEGCFPDSIVGFVPDHHTDADFLFYLLKSMKPVMLRSAILTTQLNINYVRIGSNYCAYPPKAEQKEIADYLDQKMNELTQVAQSLNDQIKTLTAYRKSLIHECVTGQRRITEEDLKEV